MTSEELLPKAPGNEMNGINTIPSLRLSFLNRFLKTPCMYTTGKTIYDYFNSSLVPATFEYSDIQKAFIKDDVVDVFFNHEVIDLILDPEGNSFRTQCCDVILVDIQYQIDQIMGIINNNNTTAENKLQAYKDKSKYDNMKVQLNEYLKDFSTHTVMNNEIIKWVAHFMAKNI